MDKHRPVTERDLRAPEFRDCEPEDLEWRADGTLARKDRWENGIRLIAGIVGLDSRKGFEVSEVVRRIRRALAPENAPTHPNLWKTDPGAGTCRAVIVDRISAALILSPRKTTQLRALLEDDEDIRRAFALLFPEKP